MRAEERVAARRQLDRRLAPLQDPETFERPPHGWVRAIREALGMTALQLGRRMGVTKQRALAVEKAEAEGSISLNNLERAAHALDCRLVYALVPRKPFEALVRDRAAELAARRLRTTGHSMALEAQGVEASDEREHLERLTRQLIDGGGSILWEEEK